MRFLCVKPSVCVTVVVIVMGIVTLLASSTAADQSSLDHIFRDRSFSDWKEAWHREKYARCRQTLLRHLAWACAKDIYRISQRSSAPAPVISPMAAQQLLRWRRSTDNHQGNSITAECCSSAGCTWEEYAEYCPTNKRLAVTYNVNY